MRRADFEDSGSLWELLSLQAEGGFAQGRLRGHGFDPDFEEFDCHTLKENAEGKGRQRSILKRGAGVRDLAESESRRGNLRKTVRGPTPRRPGSAPHRHQLWELVPASEVGGANAPHRLIKSRGSVW